MAGRIFRITLNDIMKNDITIGTKVKFESDDGPRTGRVADFKPDISNGQRIALVDVAGTLNRMPWQIPVTELKAAA